MNQRQFPRVVWEFLAATNAHDLRWLESLFTENCAVWARGYFATGLDSVGTWIEAEVIEPALSLTLDDVFFDGSITILGVRVLDHGSAYDCQLEFRTRGRYIEALAITGMVDAEAAAERSDILQQAC